MSMARSSNRKYDFNQIKLGTCVLPHFHGILTGNSIFFIVFVIQGDLQGQKVNLKVKFLKNVIFNKHK